MRDEQDAVGKGAHGGLPHVRDDGYNDGVEYERKEALMAELTATVAEARANFSKIAAAVDATGRPVTVFRNSKPWVLVAPLGAGYGEGIARVDWASDDVARIDPAVGRATLPAEWDDPADDGLYDDLA